jgi:hypothetical protein
MEGIRQTHVREEKKRRIVCNNIRPPPDIEGEEVYEVEQILKHRKCGQGYEYLINWVGYLITKSIVGAQIKPYWCN